MTDVAFHFGVPDRLAYSCRLLRKATASGARVQVRASPDVIDALDMALWSLSPVDFIAHCMASAPAAVQARSAVVLHESQATLPCNFPVLINLAEDVPQGVEAFERVIEVVSTDESDRNQARKRWKHYTERGYTISRHDIQARAGD